ncbi:SRPBCC family protein [Chryseobacterium pennipullorum]|uniref:SRPBCC domain-containing protein n=1 Tax=Chryseobacterium pennipullorum TaxID=2258963 RepID=A0A3D9BA75_9FLAO|nr:SRPBCC domain-containing protein [Chryseobacterium pennipullorum]REC50349.1 SRPBCC domain-containing protein [Chryseobacterium pennipullorum]
MDTPIIVQHKIDAPIEKIWEALTDKNKMKSWYFDIEDFEPQVGKVFNFYEPGTEKKYHHRCEILEMIPQKRMKHTWSYPDYSKLKTIVTWELIPQEEGTLVKLTHEGIENFDRLGSSFSRESFTEGWNGIIGKSLKDYIEKNNG